jgi:transcriptional regulator
MYDADTKHQFLELRAKGWSLTRIAERLRATENLYHLFGASE